MARAATNRKPRAKPARPKRRITPRRQRATTPPPPHRHALPRHPRPAARRIIPAGPSPRSLMLGWGLVVGGSASLLMLVLGGLLLSVQPTFQEEARRAGLMMGVGLALPFLVGAIGAGRLLLMRGPDAGTRAYPVLAGTGALLLLFMVSLAIVGDLGRDPDFGPGWLSDASFVAAIVLALILSAAFVWSLSPNPVSKPGRL